jgi:hypothetical protein
LTSSHFNMIFQLTEEERQLAIAEGWRRQSYNEARNISGRNGGSDKGDIALMYHKLGAAGEVAVASYLGLKDFLFKDQSPSRGSYDLPYKIDVKTRARHDYDLIVQLDDKPDKVYWLVTIENREVRIHGWIHHSDCAKREYIKDPAGGRRAYFVPKSALFPPESFFDHREPA